MINIRNILVAVLTLAATMGFSQTLVIRAFDEMQQPLSDVEVIIVGYTERNPKYTHSDGRAFIDLDNTGIIIGQEVEIEGARSGYQMIGKPHKFTIRDPTVGTNVTMIFFQKKECGFISVNQYLEDREQGPLAIGLSLGYKHGDEVTIGNIPGSIRMIPPHDDDMGLPILDPDVPDNYLIQQNTGRIDLGHRLRFEMIFSFWGIVNIAIRTSAIDQSDLIENQNLYRKNYVLEGGEALIFYALRAQEREFLSGNSFSFPIFVTYPVYCFGKNRNAIFRIVAGTNFLFPDRISLVAEQGWDRFGEKEFREPINLGKLKEVGWFGGFDIEVTPIEKWKIGIQFTVVYTDYREDFEFPLTLPMNDSVRPSLQFNVMKLF